jgi:hypothetical protein
LTFFVSTDSDSSDSDEDDNNKSVKKVTGSTSSTVPDVTAAGALGNLMSTYVVSDESGDENDTEKPDNGNFSVSNFLKS